MKRKLCVSAATLLAVLLAMPASAGNYVGKYMGVGWEVDSTQPHPKNESLSWVVTKASRLTGGTLGYSRFKFGTDPTPPKAKGKLIFSFEVLRGDETIVLLRKKTLKIKKRAGTEAPYAAVFLAAPSMTPSDWWWEDAVMTVPELPMDLEPGDVVLLSVKFKGVPQLRYKYPGDPVYQEAFNLGLDLYNCGTPEDPCPVFDY